MVFKSYSHNLKKGYRVAFEKKLKITTTTTKEEEERAPRRSRSYSSGAAKNGVLRELKHIFPNTYQRIKSICSPAKGGTGCYRFNYQPGS